MTEELKAIDDSREFEGRLVFTNGATYNFLDALFVGGLVQGFSNWVSNVRDIVVTVQETTIIVEVRVGFFRRRKRYVVQRRFLEVPTGPDNMTMEEEGRRTGFVMGQTGEA